MKLGIEEHKNEERNESVREENEKEAKGSCGFKRAEEENQTEASGSSNKSWSSNPRNRKTNPQDNKQVTSSTGPIMNFQEGYNKSAEEHKINSLEKTDNLLTIYNETTTEVYIDKEERIRPENSNNHNTDIPDIYLDKPKQEVNRKDQEEQEIGKKELVKNSETNVEIQQDLEKRERNEGQYDEETTVQKEQDNISEILINKEIKSEEMISNDKLNVKVNSISQVKQISNELIQDNNYYTNLTKLGHEQTEQSQSIKLNVSETDTESKDKEVENQTTKLEREEIITYTAENTKNNRDLTEKYERKRVQHFEERIEEVVAEEIRVIRTRAKQKEHHDVTKKVSNRQLQKETLVGDGKNKGKSRRTKE